MWPFDKDTKDNQTDATDLPLPTQPVDSANMSTNLPLPGEETPLAPLTPVAPVTPIVPEEVKEYYQAEKRERLGMAWLLALATFFAVVIVVIGLFMGGRVVYHHFGSKNKTATTQTTQATDQTNDSGSGSSSNSGSTTPPAASTPAAPAPQTTPAPTTPTPTTPAPATTNPKLVNTGPGDVVAIFVGISAAAAAAYHIVSNRKTS